MSHEFRLGGPFLFQPVDEGNWVKLYIGAMCDPYKVPRFDGGLCNWQGWWGHDCRRYAEADDRVILDATMGSRSVEEVF